MMARATGVRESTVGRIWKQSGLKPHRLVGFKISDDPRFEGKLLDIVGLYLDPPEHAIVLSVDEKRQIQALDRSQRGLPLKQGCGGTMPHDDKRNGTTARLAALNTLDGTVISKAMPRHRHGVWLKFLKRLHRGTPRSLALHIICDNSGAHKHPEVTQWLERHRRVHVPFTPTSSSWLNRVERYFRDLTENRIRRGIFRSVSELEAAIQIDASNPNRAPKPFIWTASANDILA